MKVSLLLRIMITHKELFVFSFGEADGKNVTQSLYSLHGTVVKKVTRILSVISAS